MNIIIIGCGKLGHILADQLSDEGHNISIVDHENEKLNDLGSGFNGLKVKGIEYDEEVLKEAGILEADALLCVTNDENVNITVSMIAKRIYHVPHIIARILNPNRQYLYDELGIETYNTTQVGALAIQDLLFNEGVRILYNLDEDWVIAQALYEGKEKEPSLFEKEGHCRLTAFMKEGKTLPLATTLSPGVQVICLIEKRHLMKLKTLCRKETL